MNGRNLPEKCKRMVAAYKRLGYQLVRPDRHNLLKMRRAVAVDDHRPITVYIHANPDSPYCGVALLNRRKQ